MESFQSGDSKQSLKMTGFLVAMEPTMALREGHDKPQKASRVLYEKCVDARKK